MTAWGAAGTRPVGVSWDELLGQLAALRVERGAPSYGEIAGRVGAIRARRGEQFARPGRSTVFDLFRPGRRRVDVALLLDVVRALGGDPDEVTAWFAACQRAGRAPSSVPRAS